jgi:hypothetical protein
MLFQGAKLLGSPRNDLPLATRKGNDIPNEIIPPPDEAECRKLDAFIKQYGAQWEQRKPHMGVYNCAGHVWASRRTAILDEDAVWLILRDDGYRVLRTGESPMQGDLVLYWHRPASGKDLWLHVGMVCEIRILGTVRIPWIISKWGATAGEWLHRCDDVPYDKQGFTTRVEFRTDRP